MDYQPECALKHQQSAEGNDNSRDPLPDDQLAHQRPDQDRESEADAHRQRRGYLVFEDQHAGDAPDKPHTATDGQVDHSREKNQQHAQRQGRGDRQFDRQHRQVARAKEIVRRQGEEDPDANQPNGDREVAYGNFAIDGLFLFPIVRV